MGQKRWYRLKLNCRDEAKGPVTALCSMDNYLVSSMGQKVRCHRVAILRRSSHLASC